MFKKNFNKLLSTTFALSLLNISSYANDVKIDNTPPEINYTEERIGDRERLRVTVNVSDESGIREFRDPQGNTIIGDSITVEFDRRGDSTFTAIDNVGNKSEVVIDLNWINPYTPGIESMKDYGSFYWSSSNLREWLNSDDINVKYTGNAPTDENMNGDGYADEYGFLNEFTESEKEAIAVTEHRIFVPKMHSNAIEGGISAPPSLNHHGASFLGSYPHVADNYKDMYYKSEKDKVFILNSSEAYWYIYRRGIPLIKETTSFIQEKYNKKNEDWWVQGGFTYSGKELGYLAQRRANMLSQTSDSYPRGVVPAIHINPSYVFSDGHKAETLLIGDLVFFGTYKGEPIEWRVLNITDNGFPLLVSEKILDLKKFDAKGDKARLYSDFCNYNDLDVSILNDIQYKSTTMDDDIDIPLFEILNEEELMKRQNQGYSLTIRVFDEGDSGVKSVTLPNGSTTNDELFNYNFTKNGVYHFKVYDNAGNYNEFSIPVGNINQEPELDIIVPAEEWLSSNAEINIKSSNKVHFKKSNLKIGNNSQFNGPIFPNYIGYNNCRFKIKGSFSLIKKEEIEALDNATFGIGLSYNTAGRNKYSYTIGNAVDEVEVFKLKDIEIGEVIDFEKTITVSPRYAFNLYPKIFINRVSSTVPINSINLIIHDITFEMEEDSNFNIESIILPDGTEIKDVSSYTDTVPEDGIHILTYKIKDNRGKITEKTVTVKIDKTKPTLNLEYDLNNIIKSQSVIIDVSGSDNLSGFKRMKLPDGTYVSTSNVSYTITQDGNYIFECEDVAGNITQETVMIKGIDIFKDAERLVETAEQTKESIDIEVARDTANKLPESSKKDELQDRLNAIAPNISIKPTSATSNLDVYIKSGNMLSLSLNSNSITFKDFNGTEDLEKQNVLELSINSSLPYEINAFLEGEIQNADKSEIMNSSILNLKESSTTDYKEFPDIKTKLTLVPHGDAGNNKTHSFDFKLNGGIAHKKDIYKAVIKFEVKQK